jgi:hypothetical protein
MGGRGKRIASSRPARIKVAATLSQKQTKKKKHNSSGRALA